MGRREGEENEGEGREWVGGKRRKMKERDGKKRGEKGWMRREENQTVTMGRTVVLLFLYNIIFNFLESTEKSGGVIKQSTEKRSQSNNTASRVFESHPANVV